MLAGFVNRIVASRRASRAEKELRASIRAAIEDSVGVVASEECARATRIEGHVEALRSR